MAKGISGLIPVASQLTDDITSQLPDEVQELIEAAKIKQDRIITALEDAIKKKRDDAVKFRNATGIETEWTEDEEFYEGIDDANRGEPRMVKPYHPSGVVQTIARSKKSGSTVFMNITRQYVDTAAASVSELGNPTDDRNFSIKPAPDAVLEDEKDSITPNPGNPQQTIGQFARSELEKQVKSALMVQNQVDEWFIECGWHGEMRKAVHAAAKIGTGCVKGPFPSIHKKRIVKHDSGKHELIIESETIPASKNVSIWNVYPDPACGDDIQRGGFLLEKDAINGRQLREMKELDGYFSLKIDEVLKDGPHNDARDKSDKNKLLRADTYEVWYYYGQLSREEIEAMKIPDALDQNDPTDAKAIVKIESMEAMPCLVTMVNDTIVRASLNPLDSGEYPYDFVRWEKREGSPWGRGISRIMRPAQRVVNASIRNLMDNAALSGGVQVAFRKGKIKPMGGGQWNLKSQGFWEIIDEEITDVKQAISFIELPSRQQEIMAIIQFGQKMAEDITGMPLLQQGQTGSAPDTVGGMQLLNENATSTRRMVARQIDDEFTEPHVRRYYDWILMYGDDKMKGDFVIDARGSQALVERDMQRQFAETLLKYSQDARFEINPKKAMELVLRSRNTIPSDVQFTDAEIQQNSQQQAAPAPAVQAAQIRAASAEKIEAAKEANDAKIAAAKDQATIQAVQERTQRDNEAFMAQQKAEQDQGLQQMQLRREELALEREIAILNYSTKQNISLQDAKTQLAQTTMKLQTEKELAAAAQQMAISTKQSDAALAVHGQINSNMAQTAAHEHEDAAMLAAHAHERKLQAEQHLHEKNVANLQPAVQVPGRAGKGNALNQMP